MGDTLAYDSGSAVDHAPAAIILNCPSARQGIISNGQGQTAQARAPRARLSPKERLDFPINSC